MKLAWIFSDGMVLQRGIPVPVWGTGTPGEKVSVALGGQSHATKVDKKGAWRVTLDALEAGGPHTLTVAGRTTQTVKNVLIGDVWICSGQSNMEWPLDAGLNSRAEVAEANYPQMRLITIPRQPSDAPQADVAAAWQVCTPKTAKMFSAVAYFFGRKLLQELQVPIGLIHSSWGGSCAEAWTPLAVLESHRQHKPIVDRYRGKYGDISQVFTQWSQSPGVFHKDTGNQGVAKGYAAPECDISGWGTLPVPSYWQQHGMLFNGAVWLRRDVEVPEAWQGRNLLLTLGRVDDFDTTYFNGVEIGAIGASNPNAYATEREYRVPAALVRPGRNVVAVRVFDHYGNGGITGPADAMALAPADGAGQGIPLAGVWRCMVERKIEIPPPAEQPSPQASPAVLYNAMIAPLIPYAIRGAIWYQGESNAERACQYRTLFPAMIRSWRTLWGQGAFPFLFVQLANWKPAQREPLGDEWAELREAQTLALAVPNTGMAVAVDIGDAAAIHPKNKQDVGLRLALAALAKAHGRQIQYSGPLYESHAVKGGSVRVRFQHAQKGLVCKGRALTGFAIAGVDQKFVWAQARIDGSSVIVSSAAVKKPVAVRYGWAANPACNLYNAEGLPASPFRTDDWPGVTSGRS